MGARGRCSTRASRWWRCLRCGPGGSCAAIRFVRGSALFAIPGVLLVVGTIMYTTAAAHGQLSLVSVLGSLFPIVTVGLGMGLLGERLSRFQAVGVAAALGRYRSDRAVMA